MIEILKEKHDVHISRNILQNIYLKRRKPNKYNNIQIFSLN